MLSTVSTSAKGVAYLRHLEVGVSKDTLAEYFFDADGKQIAEKWLRLYPYLARKIAIRGRYIEDTVVQYSKEKNIRQILNIAAGLNTFPYRHPEAGRFDAYMELDLPHMIEFKKAHVYQMKKQGVLINTAPEIEYVSFDLSSESTADNFSSIDWNWERPSIYIFEGICYYLTYEKVKSLIDVFADTMVGGSVLIMDYFPDMARQNRGLMEILNDLPEDGAETCLTYLNADRLNDLFQPSYTIISDKLEKDLESRYYPDVFEPPTKTNERGSIVIVEKTP